MKKPFLCLTTLMALALTASAEDSWPKTLMTQRGKLLVSEDFAKPLTPFTGVPVGFASGFNGWRYNIKPKAGKWEQLDGVFRGVELVESHHPATASYGIQYKDAIIQCEVRLDNVPADGRPYRTVFVNVTDTKDYMFQLSVGIGGVFLTPFDADRIDPKSGQRMRDTSAISSFPVKLDVWHTLMLELMGDEAVGTLDGRSIRISNPLIKANKHSVMIGAGTQGSFRNFRVWEALPNKDWPQNKQAIPTALKAFQASKLPELDAAIKKAVADGMIVGASLWVEREGESYHKAFGNRALNPAIEPMTEDTIFDVASVTKVVATTTAAMLCVERGLIGVDDPVSKHLTEFTGEGREKITLRHLLLHTSGLQVNLNGTKQPFSHTPEEAFAQACREKPLFEPGSAFSYSSVGTMVLGMVIERATGRKIDEFCTAEIFRPLKMNDTQFRPSGETLKRVAPSSAPERGLVDDTVAREMGNVSGHASLFTTAGDLARFARMMLNGGELDGVRLLKPETIKLMTRVQSPPELRNFSAGNLLVRRGLGWDIDTPYRAAPDAPTLSTRHRGAWFPVGGYGHTGWTGQMLWIDPFSKTFVIFLCNRYGADGKDTRPAVYQMHHRIATLAAEAVKGFDFKSVPGALPSQASAQAIKDKPFTNSLGMKFVPVPGTQILMCIHETRRADYAAYAALHPEADASWQKVIFDGQPVSSRDDEPAVNVSWNAAQAFCQWLSQKEGRRYRLPTDREWSIAVGIGDREPATGTTPESLSGKLKDEYPWGRVWPPVKGAGNFADEDCHRQCPSEKTMEGYADGFSTTSPVMSFPPNALGIHDLSGSVWEWCEDFMNATKTHHVLRGGSWGTSARNALLSSFRGGQPSARIWRCDGFRCVLVVQP
jgi:CubicO group peptidase (beta-lactamase class C family)